MLGDEVLDFNSFLSFSISFMFKAPSNSTDDFETDFSGWVQRSESPEEQSWQRSEMKILF